MFRILLAAFFLLLAPTLLQAQSPRLQELIYEEAYAAGVPPRYVFAIASVGSGFDANHVDGSGGVGILAVRPGLATQFAPDTVRWLDHPPANVHAGVTVLAGLKSEHGDWRRALNVYRGGKPRATASTRRWVDAVLRQATATPAPAVAPWQPHRRTRPHHGLDDFGYRPVPPPRAMPGHGRGWQPIHRYIGDE